MKLLEISQKITAISEAIKNHIPLLSAELLELASEIRSHCHFCEDCGKEVEVGCGLQKDGEKLTKLCKSCTNKRVWNEPIRSERVV